MTTALAHDALPSPNRDALAGGQAFLEASATPDWGISGLGAWFDEHLVMPGHMRTPLVVTEPTAGTVSFHGHASDPGRDPTRILLLARTRVLSALRGLIASPADDRFLSAHIFTGRVWRQRVQGVSRWVPRPEPTAPLSAVVLSLFTVDVLSHREIYTQSLSVCDACDRVTFHEGARWRCVDHAPPLSGFFCRKNPEERGCGMSFEPGLTAETMLKV